MANKTLSKLHPLLPLPPKQIPTRGSSGCGLTPLNPAKKKKYTEKRWYLTGPFQGGRYNEEPAALSTQKSRCHLSDLVTIEIKTWGCSLTDVPCLCKTPMKTLNWPSCGRFKVNNYIATSMPKVKKKKKKHKFHHSYLVWLIGPEDSEGEGCHESVKGIGMTSGEAREEWAGSS